MKRNGRPKRQQKETAEFEIRNCLCPVCGITLNLALGHHKPEQHDLLICGSCLNFLKFDSTLTLSRLSEEEFYLLSPEDQMCLMELRTALSQLPVKEIQETIH